jgi:hypothetical protein
MKEKTAVEWLIDESMKLVVQYMQGTLNEDNLDDVIYEIGDKAKEMEKQQHGKTWDEAIDEDSRYNTFEQYYNETFKSE